MPYPHAILFNKLDFYSVIKIIFLFVFLIFFCSSGNHIERVSYTESEIQTWYVLKDHTLIRQQMFLCNFDFDWKFFSRNLFGNDVQLKC